MNRLKIREGAFIARIAARKLGCRQVAIVFGDTIYLHNTTRQAFLSSESWVRHELVHLEQFRRYGTPKFIFLYLLESIRNGYHNNRFEKEAREAESTEATPLPQS